MQLSVLTPNAQGSSYLERTTAAGTAAFKAGSDALTQRPLASRLAAAVPATAAAVVGGLAGLAASPLYAVERVASKRFLAETIGFVGYAAYGAAALAGLASIVTYLTGAALPALSIGEGAAIAGGGLGLAVFGQTALEVTTAFMAATAGKTFSAIANGYDRLGIAAKKPQA